MQDRSDGASFAAPEDSNHDHLHFSVKEILGHTNEGTGKKVEPEDEAPTVDSIALNGEEGPRGTKRKLSTPVKPVQTPTKKQPSPPWAKFEPKNPTSFSENGLRKSGRTNALPLELQPQGATRGRRAAYLHSHDPRKYTVDRSETTRKQYPRHSAGTKSSPKSKSSSTSSPTNSQTISSFSKRTRHSLPRGGSQVNTHNENFSQNTNPQESARRNHRRKSFNTIPLRDFKSGITGEKNAQTRTEPVRTLRLHFRRPEPPLLHPGTIVRKPKYASLEECFQQNISLAEDNEKPYSDEQIRREALMRQRLERAARPGGILHGDAWLMEEMTRQPEPDVPKTANFFLCEHVKMFVKELTHERARHRREAKQLAIEARERWLSKQPRSAESLREAERKRNWTRFRMAMKELQEQWSRALEYTKRQKQREYEEQQQRRITQNLQDLVQSQTDAAARRKRRRSAISIGEDHDTGYNSEASDHRDSVTSDDSENLEDTETDDDESLSDTEASEGDDEDPYSGFVGEELRRKVYGDLEISGDTEGIGEPEHERALDLKPEAKDEQRNNGHFRSPGSHISHADLGDVPLDEVDAIMLDDEDEADTSGSETDESDESVGSTSKSGSDEEAAEESDEENVASSGLLGFFSKKVRNDLQELSRVQDHEHPNKKQSSSMVDIDHERLLLDESGFSHIEHGDAKADPMSNSEDMSLQGTSGQDTPATTVTSKPSDFEKSTPQSTVIDEEMLDDSLEESKFQTPVPSLLRGSLRTYQHQGLDWLTGMYESDTNGILADEMGLGKTIQTIALLAHLATSKEIWGPHLVVVPTSVMLNWEMEFKKWCPGFKILTYYGTQEERKEKRRGWTNDDKWNVCITSYQLVLQDASSLKRRNWHYLVLDEAHNIKNFKSQRWQTLLMFKSQARLLLTGTPLQNNLTELWSLLFFLAPELDESGESKFKDLKEFAFMFKRPVEQILDHGREALDDQAKDIITKLHHVLRPHLLRRLKADVEKQMPKKYEHVVKCRLSKRQRQLYDGYMGLAGTRESFASGNYMSIINCLMQLRKVCNHPDLFETRQIVTSYAMPKSAVAHYEIQELLVRRRLLSEDNSNSCVPEFLKLWQRNTPSLHQRRVKQLAALKPLAKARELLQSGSGSSVSAGAPSTMMSALNLLDNGKKASRRAVISNQYEQTSRGLGFQPAYPIGLLGQMNFEKAPHLPNSNPKRRARLTEWYLNTSTVLKDLYTLRPDESPLTELAVRKFGCITPAVIAPAIARHVLTEVGMDLVQQIRPIHTCNPFHEAQTRLSIAFPDKNLIQYDCGKLQQLDKLLRQLQAGGHRALIFTQMTKVLDILEQFLNLHGHRYLRLDGSTKVESRQALTDQFNNDSRILAFILSSRSGGIGINLTGADTVIFYDLDWNPAMDKQCQDRCHRIGQTRDVHIYRFVSEGTIEANILRKSNQKRMLDDVVIQEGEFTTDAFYRSDEGEELNAEADAALDKVLGGGGNGATGLQKQEERALDLVEDAEDREAAKQAQKETAHTDDVDFQESTAPPLTAPPDAKYDSPKPPDQLDTAETDQADDDAEATHPEGGRSIGAIDQHFISFMAWELADVVFVPISEKQRKRAKKGPNAALRIRT